jgi:hypothetical protein
MEIRGKGERLGYFLIKEVQKLFDKFSGHCRNKIEK